ncbi:MAG TPA: phosphoenolpyruvate carboxykinase (ATP), partial [Gemmatimonadaceae bacterium]
MATQTTPRAEAAERKGKTGLEQQGLAPRGKLHWNLVAPELIQAAVRRDEGTLADMGPFVGITTPHTGRSPKDKFIVREPGSEQDVWWGKINQPFEPASFDKLLADVQAYLDDQHELFIEDLWAGADPSYRLSVRFVSPNAWQMLFARNMFVRPEQSDLPTFVPDFTVLHTPEFQADPKKHGTRSGTFIIINFDKRIILIGGTRYAGEIKKCIFTVMNYVLPKQGVLSMHCSANIGEIGDTALFFGLSGTGKTTLSADPERYLIGDDEHGWSEQGVFNFEGGCYAKVINLSEEGEPDIYRTTQMFGTVLENVVLDPNSRRVDFRDQSLTENTRASYPLHYIRNHVPGGRGG